MKTFAPKFVAVCVDAGFDPKTEAGSNPAACTRCLNAEWQSGRDEGGRWLTLSVCRVGCRLQISESQALEWRPVSFCSARTMVGDSAPLAGWDSLKAHGGYGGEVERPSVARQMLERVKQLRSAT